MGLIFFLYSANHVTYFMEELGSSLSANPFSWKNRVTKLVSALINAVVATFVILSAYLIYSFFMTEVIYFKMTCGDTTTVEDYWRAYADHLGGLHVFRIGMTVMGYQLVIRTFLMFGWLLINKFPECAKGPNVLFEQNDKITLMSSVEKSSEKKRRIRKN